MFQSLRLNVFAVILFMAVVPGQGLAAPTSVGANREWVRTAVQDQINQGQLDKAIEILRNHLKTDEKDSESWARLALLQRHLDKCSDAKASLSMAARVGSAGFRDIYQSAAEQLSPTGCRPDISEQAVISSEPEATSKGEWASSVRMLVGHDSNVLLLSDSSTASTSPSSAFVSPTANFAYSWESGAGKFTGRSTSSYTSYLANEVTSYNSLSQSLFFEWSPKIAAAAVWEQTLSNRFDTFFVNSDGMKFFSWINSLRASLSRSLDDSSRWGFDGSVGYQQYAAETATSDDDRRDGSILSPSVWYARRFDKVVWTSSLSYAQAFAAGPNYKSEAGTVVTGFNARINEETRSRASIGFTKTDYHRHLLGREDERLDLSLGLLHNFPAIPKVNFSLDLLIVDNKSNLTGASYKRSTLMGQVDYAF